MTDADAAPAGRLPDFLLIGATKAGSTSLHAYLRQHRGVFVHPRKEMRFLTEEHRWKHGPEWYAAQFAEAREGQVVGEASNAYTRHPVYVGAPERAAALMPGVKLVYLIREPFARLESHYRWRLSTGYEWRPPAEALRADQSYVAASLYGLQLAEWRRHFQADQILVLRCEDLFAEPAAELRRLSDHLGVEHDPFIPFRAENQTRHRRPVATPFRRLAHGPLRRPIRRLGRAAARGPLGALGGSASEAAYELPRDLRASIADLFEEDRQLLRDLAGAQIAIWPEDRGPVGPQRIRLHRSASPGLAESPAAWIGAALTPSEPDPSEPGASGGARKAAGR